MYLEYAPKVYYIEGHRIRSTRQQFEAMWNVPFIAEEYFMFPFHGFLTANVDGSFTGFTLIHEK